MSRQIPLLLCWGFILWAIVRDRKRRTGISGALWIVFAWAVIIGSRSISTWFSFSGEAEVSAEAYDAGNPLERLSFFLLIAAGLVVLAKRRVRFREVANNNRWLLVFYLYCLLSVLWADSPLIAFKRYVKDAGNVVMVLVVLTEVNPVDAIKTVFARCMFLLIPLSVLFIRYYSELGRAFHTWSGEMMYTGVATHKNTLGMLVLACGLFFFWDVLDRWQQKSRPLDRVGFAADLTMLLMSAWLLYTSHSATSLACGLVGASLLVGLRLPIVARNLRLVARVCAVTVVLFFILDAAFGLREGFSRAVLGSLNRDPTLTGRTDAWKFLISEQDNPLFGAGFNSFWSGERLRRMWEEYSIIQAHNGYVEAYLNGGLIGLSLLLGFLLSSGRRIWKELLLGMPLAQIRFVVWLVVIIFDFTEAAFSKMCLLWVLVLFALMKCPPLLQPQIVKKPAEPCHDPEMAESEVALPTG